MTELKVVKRTGELVEFDDNRVRNAIQKAVRAVDAKLEPEVVDGLVTGIITEVEERFTDFFPNVENIQDIVEKHLVNGGFYEIGKEYILYRSKRQKEREEKKEEAIEKAKLGKLSVKKRDGKLVLFDLKKIKDSIKRSTKGLEQENAIELITKEVIKNIYDGLGTEDIERALILGGVAFIEKDTNFNYIAARLFLQKLYKEVMGKSITSDVFGISYRESFVNNVKKGVEATIFDKRLLEFDLDKLSYGLKLERDQLFGYIGVQTLYERYFSRIDGQRIELPQAFWMRVSMGLAINEKDKDKKALEFYDVLSSLRFVSSSPTLFNAGTSHPQLSSCYLTTISDDLHHIFKCLGDNAQLSKWSGGLGNDWTNIRSIGSIIQSNKIESQGVIPFLKIANDVTVAISRSGRKRGATCAYLETWHLDIEDYLDLRKNTGDDRRRTHDMNTANWIPDLFMKRVLANEQWTLFSANEVPELHHLYGRKFEKKYQEYEEKAQRGETKKFKVVSAQKLWRKMLSMLFETGHPWLTFKDPCNIRSPQDHAGVVHSSNLCTEITLNTSEEETAVCNLGSINLEKHVIEGKLDESLVGKTVKTAINMLDNVIDLNFYPTKEAKHSNLKHRPIGMGLMGFQDALFKLNINFASPAALKFADNSMELIAYHAILASSQIAKNKGKYESYEGSKWDRGIFPLDTIDLLEEERGMKIEVPREARLDWGPVREHVKKYGMRNSNTLAIAPTATIANIAGCYPCIEPIYKNIYVKSNISGEFTIVNHYLLEDLKKLSLWNEEMMEQLKYHDGNLQMITSIPEELKLKYQEAFEIDPEWCLKLTAVRGKWIDQSQSHNVFMRGVSGNKLNDIYMTAWKLGLKTTYYLRTLAASQIEKSTLDASKFGYTQKREYTEVNTQEAKEEAVVPATQVGKVCTILDPECEACQ